MRVRVVHITIDGRSKTIPLPDEYGDLSIKIETDAGLMSLALPQSPTDKAETMRRLRVASKRKQSPRTIWSRHARRGR